MLETDGCIESSLHINPCPATLPQGNPYPAKVIYLNFQPLDVVSRYRDPQLQVVENYSHLFNLRPNDYKS